MFFHGILIGSLVCTVGFILWTFFVGLACRPIDFRLHPCLLLSVFLRGTPILAGGIGVARVVVGVVFAFVCFVVQLDINA